MKVWKRKGNVWKVKKLRIPKMDGHCTDGWCILRISKSRTSLQSDQFSVSNSTTSAAFLFNQYYYWLQLKCVQNIDICPLFSPSGELYLGLITYMSNHTFIVESTNISWLIRLGCKMDEKLWAMRFIHFWPSSSHRCNVHCEICIYHQKNTYFMSNKLVIFFILDYFSEYFAFHQKNTHFMSNKFGNFHFSYFFWIFLTTVLLVAVLNIYVIVSSVPDIGHHVPFTPVRLYK